ncbi:MAG: hypothetical protein QM496_09585 [Verrucomicrobiota bacterium]
MNVPDTTSSTPTEPNTNTNNQKLNRACLVIAFLLISGWAVAVNSESLTIPDHDGKGRSLNMALNLKSSISTYYTEYRNFPVKLKGTEDIDLLSNTTLMDVLSGDNITVLGNELNPRQITFFSARKAKFFSGEFHGGIGYDTQGRASLFDQWGNLFHIRFDLNLDNQVALPYSAESQASNMIPQSIIVWSAGEDQIEGTSDDIKTW